MRIALLTDFGTRDPYVAAMKGVLAAGTNAPVFDLSHDIAPFDAWEAAFFLRDAVPYWPTHTIFVAVIDPGVGSSRRILAVESRGKIFLAPDNGVLHFIDGPARSVENERLFLPDGSTTFHGRDRFAPVAAAIASGLPLADVGPEVQNRLKLDYEPPAATRGTIIRIDRFGNAVTDLSGPPSRVRDGSPAGFSRLRTSSEVITRWSTTYEGDGPFLIIGSTGCIEISVARGSAAKMLQLRRGDRVEIEAPAEAGGAAG
jgi:S-adenosylmethionine hydrolase